MAPRMTGSLPFTSSPVHQEALPIAGERLTSSQTRLGLQVLLDLLVDLVEDLLNLLLGEAGTAPPGAWPEWR